MTEFGRLMTAMITPFNEKGEVDYKEAIKVAEFLVETGTDTIVLAGTTGESPTLTHEEEFTLFKTIRDAVGSRVKLMAGTGSNCTRTAIASTKEAEKLGLDASLQVVPYYNRPSQEGLYQHFKAIAESVKFPILLYNIPGRTGRNMEPETIARLAEIPNIIGIKEAAGSVEQVAKIRQLTPPDFLIYSGDDGLTLAFMKEGAYGVVSVASHCVGRQIKDMMTLFAAGNQKEAYQIEDNLNPIFKVLFINSNPAPLKYALHAMGFKVGIPRLPLVEVTPNEKDQIAAVLQALEIVAEV